MRKVEVKTEKPKRCKK